MIRGDAPVSRAIIRRTVSHGLLEPIVHQTKTDANGRFTLPLVTGSGGLRWAPQQPHVTVEMTIKVIDKVFNAWLGSKWDYDPMARGGALALTCDLDAPPGPQDVGYGICRLATLAPAE